MTIYDALDHQIGGVQQQQGGAYGTLSFTSQRGTFTVDSLPLASVPGQQQAPKYQPQQQPLQSYDPPPAQNQSGSQSTPRTQQEVLTALERLADLHQKGILTESEFQSKKAELLSRI